MSDRNHPDHHGERDGNHSRGQDRDHDRDHDRGQDRDHDRGQDGGRDHPTAPARLVTGIAWTVLLLGLWLWGRDATDGTSGPATGDMAAAGRPPYPSLPPAHRPLAGDAEPHRLDIPRLGIRAPVTGRGLDARGAPEPPPSDSPGTVGWWASGTTPGAAGTALMVGHVDTETRPAVFHRLSTLEPGDTIRVLRDTADGTGTGTDDGTGTDGTGGTDDAETAEVAEFTVDDVQVLPRDGFDARRAYGPRRSGRAELRLITCGGTFDRAGGTYTANMVVSAYLTGTGT